MTSSKQRSPNYPGHSLITSLEDIKKLYDKEGRSTFSSEAAAKDLGYNGLNGPSRVRLATIRQYGLLERIQGDESKLTDRALTLVLRSPTSKEYKDAIKEAALEPPLFRQIYETKSTASDDNLMHYLVVNEGFTNDGAKKFIESFKNTKDFANLADNTDTSRQDEDKDDEEVKKDSSKNPPFEGEEPVVIDKKRVRVPLHLVGGTEVIIDLPTNITEKAWEHMLRFLEVMKEGYVGGINETSSSVREVQKKKPALSQDAKELLKKVNDGGIPLAITPNMEKIAKEHGIVVENNMTPNKLIDELKKLI